MNLILVVIIVIVIPVILFPAAFVWYLNFETIRVLIKKAVESKAGDEESPAA